VLMRPLIAGVAMCNMQMCKTLLHAQLHIAHLGVEGHRRLRFGVAKPILDGSMRQTGPLRTWRQGKGTAVTLRWWWQGSQPVRIRTKGCKAGAVQTGADWGSAARQEAKRPLAGRVTQRGGRPRRMDRGRGALGPCSPQFVSLP
jgi:hypothetical protein